MVGKQEAGGFGAFHAGAVDRQLAVHGSRHRRAKEGNSGEERKGRRRKEHGRLTGGASIAARGKRAGARVTDVRDQLRRASAGVGAVGRARAGG